MKERNSSIELLRIISILLITLMHLLAPYWNNNNQTDMVTIIFLNSICNAGVTCFVLISGYYGINFKIRSLFKITNLTWFYSLLFLAIASINRNNVLMWDYLSGFFPISSNKYWFITSYVIVFFLSPILNLAKDSFTRNQFLIIVCTLLYFFYISPSGFIKELTNDSGKGPLNMITVYMVGQFLSKYGIPKILQNNFLLLAVLSVGLMTAADYFTSLTHNKIWMPYCRDNSVFILVLALSIFTAFSRYSFCNQKINSLASYTLAAYIIQENIKPCINKIYGFEGMMLCSVFIKLIVVIMICLLIEYSRRRLFGRLFERLMDVESVFLNRLISHI